MDIVWRTIGTVLAGCFVSFLVYIFTKNRQLYATSTTLFQYTELSEKGTVCELTFCNNGSLTEEEIKIEIDQDVKFEMLASSSSNIRLESSSFRIERMHKGKKESVLLLVETPGFTYEKIKNISSKNIQGEIKKDTASIPPNKAKTILGVLVILSIMFGVGYLFYKQQERIKNKDYVKEAQERVQKEDEEKNKIVITELKTIHNLGWDKLTTYFNSDLRKSYSNQEFPISLDKIIDLKKINNNKIPKNISRYKLKEVSKDSVILIFNVYNKTAETLEISADRLDNVFNRKKMDLTYYSNIEIPPMSKGQMGVIGKLYPDNMTHIKFSFTMGEEYIPATKYSMRVKD